MGKRKWVKKHNTVRVSDTWQPTDMLLSNHGRSMRVQRLHQMGVGSAEKGTEEGVVYWSVIPSPRFANRTNIHIITLVPETHLKPLAKKEHPHE